MAFKGITKLVFNRSKSIFIIKLVDGCMIRTCSVYLQIYQDSKPISTHPELMTFSIRRVGCSPRLSRIQGCTFNNSVLTT